MQKDLADRQMKQKLDMQVEKGEPPVVLRLDMQVGKEEPPVVLKLDILKALSGHQTNLVSDKVILPA